MLSFLQKQRKQIALGCLIVFLQGCASSPKYTPVKPISFPRKSAPTTVLLPAAFSAPRTMTHEVGPQETLWRISKMYNVDIQDLMRANGISDPSLVKNGQTLTIPNTTGPVPVIPLYPTKRWTYIVIHHTATETGNARSIDTLHHKRGFWNGLGYHFLIDNGTDGKMDGQIEVGPRWVKQEDGAHANKAGMNEKGIGISLVGNYSETTVSEKSLSALVFLVKTLQDYYRIPDENIIRHSEVPGKATECPGLNFPWAEFKRRMRSA